MVDINKYILNLNDLLKKEFKERLIYVGLQGSYLRGEATENSDIDIMVIIDELSVLDLAEYRSIIESLGDFDKSCGFICSKEDMKNWNPLEICNLINSTKDYYGVLTELVPSYTNEDIKNFIKFSINNLYHEICHRYIHSDKEKNALKLPFAYKGVFFILQNLYFLTSGEFIFTRNELLNKVSGKDYEVLKRSMEYGESNFDESFELLFSWCQETLKTL